MSYRLNNTGQEVQTVIDEMQSRTPHATKEKPGFMGADDKMTIEALQDAVRIINAFLSDISGVLDGSDITVAEMQVGKVYLKEGTLQIKNAPGSDGRFVVTVFSPDGIFSHVYVNGTVTIRKITADNDKVPVYLADIDDKTPDELRELVPLDETKTFYDGTATYVIFKDDASAIEKTTYGNGFIFYSRATESEWDEEQWTEIGTDHELSEDSERAVANKVIKAEFDAFRDYIDKATNEFIVLEDGFPLMLEDQKYVYPKLNT